MSAPINNAAERFRLSLQALCKAQVEREREAVAADRARRKAQRATVQAVIRRSKVQRYGEST